jgi:hypothetical protein
MYPNGFANSRRALRRSGQGVWIVLVERRHKRVRAMTGKEFALVEGEHLPADGEKHELARRGSIDVLASDDVYARREVARHSEHHGLLVVLRVADGGPRRRVAPLAEAVDVFVGELRQVPVLVDPEGPRLGLDGLVEMLKASAPLPQTMPVSSGPRAKTSDERQIVPPPTVLQVKP